MKAISLDRSRLADVLSGKSVSLKGRTRSAQSISEAPMKQGELFAVWPRQRMEGLPVCLIVRNSEARDWLAWVVTFAPTLRPFTAYCRVVEQSAFRLVTSKPARGYLPRGLLGMVLGEVLSAEGSQATPISPHAVAVYATTLSYSLARASVITPAVEFLDLAPRWLATRQLTSQRQRSVVASDVVRVAKVLLAAATAKAGADLGLEERMCALLGTEGVNSAVRELPGGDTWYSNAPKAMLGTREQRVAALEAATERLRGQREPPSGFDSFVMGFLASLIAPGSIAHAPLVVRNLDLCPMSAIWYSACSSLSEPIRFASEMGGIGRRIQRDLEREWSWEARPTCDISLSELGVHLEAQKQNRDFLMSVPNLLLIELAPGIETVVSWLATPESKSRSRQWDDAAERQLAASEIREYADRLRVLATRQGAFEPKARGSQKGLFEMTTEEAGREEKGRERPDHKGD